MLYYSVYQIVMLLGLNYSRQFTVKEPMGITMIRQNSIRKAGDILKIDDFYLKNASLYGDYYISNARGEENLSSAEKIEYMQLKREYGLARQEYLEDENEVNASAFIDIHESYAAFKLGHGFEYASVEAFYQATVIQPEIEAANRVLSPKPKVK